MAQQHTPAAGRGTTRTPKRPLPAGAEFIATAMDVQGDQIQTSVYVWTPDGSCHLADLAQAPVRPEQPGDTAAALVHLWGMAQKHSSSEKAAARFLLGLYNGYRFQFDLTDFRLFDCGNFKRCMLVLAMDHMPKAEVHVVLAGLLGMSVRDMGAAFEHLAFNHRVKGAVKKADLPALRDEVAA